MAAAQNPRPDVGDILVVIHDFQARSSDELTLAKGDRVELLERDDEFGDGWFLGKHMVSSNTGLFPEVYTRPSPKGFPTGASALAAVKQVPLPSLPTSPTTEEKPPPPYTISDDNAAATASSSNGTAAVSTSSNVAEPPAATAAASVPDSSAPAPASNTTAQDRPQSPTTPTAATIPVSSQPPTSINVDSPAPTSSFNQSTPPPVSASTGYSGRLVSGHDSQVLHETLNVIDEHITDLRSPSGSNGTHLHAPTDSGSEYSSNLDHRMSYIQGEETDEEEDGLHTRSEVEAWGPDDVAEYLFTVGVEKKHCEVFRDQEITGEVILEMDQASLFIKAFDLGPVGRRLKTWQKIKALQDEVNGHGSATGNRRRSNYGSDIASEDARRSNRSRTNTLTGANNPPNMQQRLPPIDDRPISIQSRRLSLNQTPRMEPAQPVSPISPISTRGFLDGSGAPLSPRRSILHEKRPSAASIRDLHHSRRHSSTDYRASITSSIAPRLTSSGTFPLVDNTQQHFQPEPQSQQGQQQQQQHKKHPSFDRNWTLGNASSNAQQPPPAHQPLFHPRPLSSAGIQDVLASQDLDQGLTAGLSEPNVDFDRGYFSGTDADPRRRSLLQKKNRDSFIKSARGGPTVSASSYAEEQRVRSATALSRHSRFGSVDSVRDPSGLSSAAQKYYGVAGANGAAAPHRRTTSSNTTDSVRMRPALPPKDNPAPTVTKLDGSNNALDKPRPLVASPGPASPHRQGDWFSTRPGFKTPSFGLRALSDAVVGHDRNKMASPVSHADSFPKDSPMQSPSRTGSSTPSAGPSFELDSPDPRSPSTTATVTSARSNNTGAARKKGKKETSAYQRGLLKISPREAMQDADYSGWMKKKSSNLMATWKPRLFVLKGRRLAYYYSEDDDQEKGLIDISFHRVLPADNERLTGLHATLTGASTTPAVPANSNMPTLASAEADAEPTSSLKSGSSQDSIFIFKLVPPRAGLSRAVNFTKPMVHYFAVPNVKQGRLWMAALMKATIDRDDAVAITTTYQQKTISLAKARQMRHRPPALMNLDEKVEDSRIMGRDDQAKDDEDNDDMNILGDDEKRMLAAALATTNARKVEKPINGLGITYDKDGVTPLTTASSSTALPGSENVASSANKLPTAGGAPYKVESARARQFIFEPEKDEDRLPMSA
ncbi:polarized growth protein [Sporothrix brasiliensis 5110]|uniref:Polarized growth protein n=1 Tax=Sporothrix brasiliensis 5110 TaxID=1398154 RepID=A0A0C2IFW9_9PEZI|nr:polarized growth protein [Sporothrix brasiliensis 5110]KIH88096.1 polarized growth protein [Sporothrix brasiliensis 5110]